MNDETLALDEIKTVGPGNSFPGIRYSRHHCREPLMNDLVDNAVHDRWSASGGPNPRGRIQAKVRALRENERIWNGDAVNGLRVVYELAQLRFFQARFESRA